MEVGQIWETEDKKHRFKILDITNKTAAYRYRRLGWDTDRHGISYDMESFETKQCHKLVDSLEFPKEKKKVKKAQAMVKAMDGFHFISGDVFETKKEALERFEPPRFEVTQWPLAVNGVEQWIEVEVDG
jgi:hypothetical protein